MATSSSSSSSEGVGGDADDVSFVRSHSVGKPGYGGGNVTLFKMFVAKLPESKSQLDSAISARRVAPLSNIYDRFTNKHHAIAIAFISSTESPPPTIL